MLTNEETEIIKTIVQKLDQSELAALIDIMQTRRYRLNEITKKQFIDLERIEDKIAC